MVGCGIADHGAAYGIRCPGVREAPGRRPERVRNASGGARKAPEGGSRHREGPLPHRQVIRDPVAVREALRRPIGHASIQRDRIALEQTVALNDWLAAYRPAHM